MASRPQDKCGIVGISFAAGRPVAPYLYNALRALQHRGQESAGITVSMDGRLDWRRGMGYVHEVLGNMDRDPIEGTCVTLAIPPLAAASPRTSSPSWAPATWATWPWGTMETSPTRTS